MTSMTQSPKVDYTNRRAGVRRTVWITAAIAVFIFIGFFIQQWFH